MKTHFLKYMIFIVTLFLIIPVSVKASFGDLRYEIVDVDVGNDTITFSGWAFIHKTNNFNEVKDYQTGATVVSDGDHKILMRAYNLTTGEAIETIVVQGEDEPNYNFYCELFWGWTNRKCTYENYAAKEGNTVKNECVYTTSDWQPPNSYCYYEDLAFSVTFNVSDWNVSSDSSISFQIGASNNHFEENISYYKLNPFEYEADDGTTDVFTQLESVYILKSSISNSNLETDFIIVDDTTLANQVTFIAHDGILRYYNSSTNQLYSFKCDPKSCYGGEHYLGYHIYGKVNGVYNLVLDGVNGFKNGRSIDAEKSTCGIFLGGDCRVTYNYAIYADSITNSTAGPAGSNGYVVIAYGSHVKLSGSNVFQIKVKNKKMCEVTDPDKNSGVLQCNNGKTYNSTCEELMVSTGEGGARVKIEQNGNISSVLTPDRVYSGGGFNFGIMYYNTIKWSYVSGQNIDSNSKLHKAVTDAMNKKIKDYESYIAGVNISNLQMDGKTFNMVKQCTTSNKNKDYYDKELTVSCLFTIPSSTINKVGNVSYNYSNGVNIENKYYTPMNYNGDYKITADIVGMDRITENAAKNDSEDGTKWTGDWSDTFTNCQINLYTLISGVPKFIYRPIDINNPFPNRNAGINWFDWYNVSRNKDRLENTYSGVDKIDYTVTLDNNAITDIKNYNKDNNYLEWDSIDKVTNESSFITEKNYIVRGGN